MAPGEVDSWFLKPLGQTVTIIAVVVGSAVAIVAQSYQIRMEMKDAHHSFDVRVRETERALSLLPARDRWRGQDMLLWGHDLQELNPNLDVPDARQIMRDRNQADWQ